MTYFGWLDYVFMGIYVLVLAGLHFFWHRKLPATNFYENDTSFPALKNRFYPPPRDYPF